MQLRKRRLFISFDYDNDLVLKDFMIGQSKNVDSPFEIEDWSMKEAAPQRNWEAEAAKRISRSDTILVMLGPHTHRARGVSKEVSVANKLGKEIFQIIGYQNSNPQRVANAGPVYNWSWPNLKALISPIKTLDLPSFNRQFGNRSPFRNRFR
ncbi:MAG: TIR domain-containing protein [Chloroflexi bacterium]|nr:TIR domain-containing protein [Chloroflexota bacterium]MDA1228861.1 TIR domain-containing protein [Chloroflexota bacterium]